MISEKRVLLTSVPRPLGPEYGDGPSVGYELLHRQVTRAQGLFSPRSLHLHFSLEYIAENIDAPCVVLQYPSRAELIRELRKGYDYVGISFLLAVFHRMQEVVALVREHAPNARIILGGYGTVLPDEVLAPYADHICREEGVGYLRRLLGEPAIEMPYRHPLIVSRLELFGRKVSRTGMIFAGLGCPNGCDFCCTSHYFKRRHLRLLPTGTDIYRVVERYLEIDPEINLVILDEDFLLNKARAQEFREQVLRGGRPLSLFVFSSVKALSQYPVEELVEMGIDGVWIGYEGTRSGYAKQQGRPVEELLLDLREHGIVVLASMIVGFPYQDEAVVERELEGLLALEPAFCQFLIYGPTPGTPFFEKVMSEGLLREELRRDSERYYRSCDGFTAMVRHERMSPARIESLQAHCFETDYQRLGPSVYRSIGTWLRGWKKLHDSARPMLRLKAERLAREIRKAYPAFLAGRLLGPNRGVRRRIAELEREAQGALGRPGLGGRLLSGAALLLALWNGLRTRLGVERHPRLSRSTYRLPAEAPRPARVWRELMRRFERVTVELRGEQTIWVRLQGALDLADASRLGEQLARALERTRNRVVLDLERLHALELLTARQIASRLLEHRARIRILAPSTGGATVSAAFALFGLYHGTH